MPYRLLLLPVLLLVQTAIAQTAIAQSHDDYYRPSVSSIDSLQTPVQVLAFIRSIHTYNNRNITISRHKPLSKDFLSEKKIQDFGALPYEKADFDGNGYTDLLFNGYQYLDGHSFPLSFIVLSYGKNKFWMVGRYHNASFFLAKTILVGGQPGLRTLNHTGSDTLVWFQDGFIENVRPQKHAIGEIRYEFLNGGLSGDSPLKMTIYGDTVKLIKEEPDISPEDRIDSGGFFIARLDTASHRRLYTLLEHLDFPHLKEHYVLGGFDLSEASLEITYDNGKKKTISDYGMEGTWGLRALYALLWHFRATLVWYKAD